MGICGFSCIFPVPDLRKTGDYYENVFGFRRMEWTSCEQPHVCLYRDDVEIILTQSAADVVHPNHELYGSGYDAYLYTADQEALLAKFRRRGAKIVRELSRTDYQNLEFVVEDINGRRLAFGRKEL